MASEMLVHLRMGPMADYEPGDLEPRYRPGCWLRIVGPQEFAWMRDLVRDLAKHTDGMPTPEITRDAGEARWGETIVIAWQFDDAVAAMPYAVALMESLLRSRHLINQDTKSIAIQFMASAG